jgi:hypothetical protein
MVCIVVVIFFWYISVHFGYVDLAFIIFYKQYCAILTISKVKHGLYGKKGKNLCYESIKKNLVQEHRCILLNGELGKNNAMPSSLLHNIFKTL